MGPLKREYRPCSKCAGTGKQLDAVRQGELMREARHKLGISLERMAEQSGVSVSYASNLETGKRPWSEALLARWDKALSYFSRERALKEG